MARALRDIFSVGTKPCVKVVAPGVPREPCGGLVQATPMKTLRAKADSHEFGAPCATASPPKGLPIKLLYVRV
jgi:hypothetical protein